MFPTRVPKLFRQFWTVTKMKDFSLNSFLSLPTDHFLPHPFPATLHFLVLLCYFFLNFCSSKRKRFRFPEKFKNFEITFLPLSVFCFYFLSFYRCKGRKEEEVNKHKTWRPVGEEVREREEGKVYLRWANDTNTGTLSFFHPLLSSSCFFSICCITFLSLPLISFSSDRDCDSLDTLIHIARREGREKEREEEKRMRKKDLLWKKSVFLLFFLFDRILFPLIPTHWWFFSFFLSFTLAFILSQSLSSFLSPGCRSFPDFAHSLVPFLPLDFFLLYFILSPSFFLLPLPPTHKVNAGTHKLHSLAPSLTHSLTQSLNFSLRVRLRELSSLSHTRDISWVSQSVREVERRKRR